MTNSIIIGIHGLLNKPPRAVLERWWAEAVAEGLRRNLSLSHEPQFALAYWADVRNTTPIRVAALSDSYEPAVGQGPLAKYVPTAAGRARAIAQKWGGTAFDLEKALFGFGTKVESLLSNDFTSLIGVDFHDLADYYSKPHIRRTIRAQLISQLTDLDEKQIMLVAHSMGSIIAYDVLRTLDESASVMVEHFVTLGSPLGLPLVAHKIRQEFGDKRTPTNVGRWTNYADPGDKVALDCNLADEFESHHGVKVADVLVHNGYINYLGRANCHKSFGYLRTPELSEQVREFLGAGA